MKKKSGISLIILSVTILVMAILTATAIIALEDSGIIGRAKNTTTKQNEQQEYSRLQVVKNGILSNNFGEITVDTYVNALKDKGIIEETKSVDKYGNTIVKTKSGRNVYIKQDGESNVAISFEPMIVTLGSLITIDNYGDKVDYSVTVDGTVYDDWRIYYHNSEYIFLITEDIVCQTTLDRGVRVDSLTAEEVALYEIYRVGNFPKFTLIESTGCQAVAQLIRDYGKFANKTDYDECVVGAIGGPTLELFVAGWNIKGYTPSIEITTTEQGYKINGKNSISGLTTDGLYLPQNNNYWLASPLSYGTDILFLISNRLISYTLYNRVGYVRPVVCLKASIAAEIGTGDYDFSLIK